MKRLFCESVKFKKGKKPRNTAKHKWTTLLHDSLYGVGRKKLDPRCSFIFNGLYSKMNSSHLDLREREMKIEETIERSINKLRMSDWEEEEYLEIRYYPDGSIHTWYRLHI